MLKVLSDRLLLTRKEAKRKGLNRFPDGTLGYTLDNNKITFFGANWPNIAVTTGSLKSPFQAVSAISIDDLRDRSVKCAQGGQIYWESKSKLLFLFYHSEYHIISYKAFYSVLGLAVSNDKGKSFSDLGIYLYPRLGINETKKEVEVAGGTILEKEGYIYVYYCDYKGEGQQRLALARTKIDEMVSCAGMNKLSRWFKYCDPSFTEPAIKGNFSPLSNEKITWPCVSFDQFIKKYFIVFPAINLATSKKELRLIFSDDGESWSESMKIIESERKEELFYPTIYSEELPQGFTKRKFNIIYTKSIAGGFDRWSDAEIRNLTIEFT